MNGIGDFDVVSGQETGNDDVVSNPVNFLVNEVNW
jgi:hypothetical protein